VLDDLDSSLTQMINDAPQQHLPELRAADVSFMTPDRMFAPGQPTVSLFLYEVRENRDLRDPRPVVERQGDGYAVRRAPVRADCSYIVTTWAAGAAGPARIAAEHQLLGQALLWLSGFPVIPDRYLQGVLGAPVRIYPPPAMVAHLDPNQHAGDFWTAMGIPPRPAFYLTVTIELAQPLDALVGPLVTTGIIDVRTDEGQETPWIRIGGRVVEQPPGLGQPPGPGIGGAVVDILELALRTRSGDEGRYTFPRVPPGAHTVRVVAQGFQPEIQPLVVPGGPDNYVVALTPLP
jgi:hypothetical protein